MTKIGEPKVGLYCPFCGGSNVNKALKYRPVITVICSDCLTHYRIECFYKEPTE